MPNILQQNEDGSGMLVAVAFSANIRSNSDRRRAGWLITRRQNHSYRLSVRVHEHAQQDGLLRDYNFRYN